MGSTARMVLGHVTGRETLAGTSTNTYRTHYAPTALPDRPAHGWQRHDVTCCKCGNVYVVLIASTGTRMLHTCIRRVVFPLLVLASMIIPAQVGQPNAWILYFLGVIASFVVYRKMYGTQGIKPPRILQRNSDEKAQHRIFAPRR